MISDLILGESTESITIEGVDDAREIVHALAQQTHKSLVIMSHDLDHPIFDNESFVDSVKSMAAASRYAQIRILIHDSEKCVKEGHRLMTLSRRLTSHVLIRKLSDAYAHFSEAFIIADEKGYYHRMLASQFCGKACFNDPRRCQFWLTFFNEAWEHSETDPNLRALKI